MKTTQLLPSGNSKYSYTQVETGPHAFRELPTNFYKLGKGRVFQRLNNRQGAGGTHGRGCGESRLGYFLPGQGICKKREIKREIQEAFPKKISDIGRILSSIKTFLTFKCSGFKTQLCHLLVECSES